jgi:purine-cytosine permease-like protein
MSEGAKDNDGVEPGLSHTGVALLDETIELHNIDHIPESERHGRSWSQFTIWFSAQLYLGAWVRIHR